MFVAEEVVVCHKAKLELNNNSTFSISLFLNQFEAVEKVQFLNKIFANKKYLVIYCSALDILKGENISPVHGTKSASSFILESLMFVVSIFLFAAFEETRVL